MASPTASDNSKSRDHDCCINKLATLADSALLSEKNSNCFFSCSHFCHCFTNMCKAGQQNRSSVKVILITKLSKFLKEENNLSKVAKSIRIGMVKQRKLSGLAFKGSTGTLWRLRFPSKEHSSADPPRKTMGMCFMAQGSKRMKTRSNADC